MISRRTLIAGALGLGLGALEGRPLRADQDNEFVDDAELIQFLIDEGDRMFANSGQAQPYLRSQGVDVSQLPVDRDAAPQIDIRDQGQIINDFRNNSRLWWTSDVINKPRPFWADNEKSSDYYHLSGYGSPPETFEFKTDDLTFLLRKNSFELLASNPLTLIGLRGCGIADADSEGKWSSQHILTIQTPNHIDPRCLIGVWNRDTDAFCFFKGSTVPEVSHMYLYLAKISGSNLLPTGMYRYAVGTHRPSSKNPQVGALRHDSKESVIVQRSLTDLGYEGLGSFEGWEVGEPNDNIHAAFFCGRESGPYFSSAGCQVICGTHKNNKPTGSWQKFRTALGLNAVPSVRNDGQAFRYCLLTGTEASLAATSADFRDDYRRIRFGSSGEVAAEVQQRIGATPDGDFRAGSALALIRRQTEQGELESAVVTVPAAGF